MKNIKKKIAIGFGIMVLLLIVAVVGFSYYFGKQVTEGLFYQNRGNDTKSNSIAQLKLYEYDLEKFNKLYQGDFFTLEASDGVTIPVTFYSTDGKKDKDTVILVHGAGGDHVSVSPLAEMYLANNWNVITYDMRGHGASGSELVTFGYLERLDIETLVDYIEEITTGKQIVVHGQSMGGAAAGMYGATTHAKEHISAIIMDSPVYSMAAMFLGVWHEMEDTNQVPDAYILACGSLYMKLHYGFTFDDVEITDQQQYNTCKTLVIVSTQDEVCLPQHVTALYNNIASSQKELVEIDAAHVEGIIKLPETYETAVMDFLAK